MTKTASQIREIVEDAIKFSIKYQNTTHIEIEHNAIVDVIAAFNEIAEESDYATSVDLDGSVMLWIDDIKYKCNLSDDEFQGWINNGWEGKK